MKRIVFHFLSGIILFFGFIYSALLFLDHITLHNETILVPNLKSFSIHEVEDTLSKLDLRYAVVDSGAYNSDYPRGSVIEHLPKSGSRVKKDRELYLTVNPKNVSLISLPTFIDRSLRQYISEIKAKGFRVGNFIYKDDEHANILLGVVFEGKSINIGDKIEKSSVLDLVLGNGKGEKFKMPDLIGVRNVNIISTLHNFSLNKGEFYYDVSVIDTLSSFVWKQSPEEQKESINLGAYVRLWFTQDSSRLDINLDALRIQDSIQDRLDSILNE